MVNLFKEVIESFLNKTCPCFRWGFDGLLTEEDKRVVSKVVANRPKKVRGSEAGDGSERGSQRSSQKSSQRSSQKSSQKGSQKGGRGSESGAGSQKVNKPNRRGGSELGFGSDSEGGD